jgi:predicted AlkP superfamily pyrophosphatase or phosphodiesterase
MNKPNYQNGSIVNLMSAVCAACDATISPYNPHPDLSIAELKASKNIILLLIDGLGYHYVKRHGVGSTIEKYIKTSMTSVFPTTTSSAITTFATALAPMQHAVTGWFMHFKELGCVSAVLPFTTRATMQPLNGDRVSISKVLPLNPVFTHLNRLSYVVNHKRIIDSSYSVLTTMGAERVEYYGLSDFFAQIINLAKMNDAKKYIHAYWADFDALCHVHGVDSDIVHQHFKDLDEEFAELLSFLQGTDSVVIVTADHGLIDCDTQTIVHLDNHPELAEMLILPLCGEPRVAYCYVKPNKTAAFEAYVQNHLASHCELHRSEDLIEENYFGLGKPNCKLAQRIGDYTLIMKSNHVIKDCLTGEKPFTQIGVHGGLDERELTVPLIVVSC